MRSLGIVLAVVGAVSGFVAARDARAQAFTNFESGHVRPLALSPDGTRLFAVNTPDNRLAIYGVGVGTLTLQAEVQVGLEPVAVAARSNSEVWVVNHLSDSISIVQIDTTTPSLSRVSRTLLTCDEPRDIVFAGSGGNRAFITTARRGQNCPIVPDLANPGQPRALVQVWDANSLGAALGGTAIANVLLFGDTPRGLARSTDGPLSRVYAGVFQSGNRTTAITETVVSPNAQGLPPDPVESVYQNPKPPVGLIVKFDTASSTWKDERPASNWNGQVPFTLPDRDVFIIDANAATPVLIGGTNNVVGVGTILFNLAVRPNASGQIYVSNVDARNQVAPVAAVAGAGVGVGGGRLRVAGGDRFCIREGTGNHDAIGAKVRIAGDDDIGPSRKRPADRDEGLAPHHHGLADRQRLEARQVGFQPPRHATARPDHAVLRDRGNENDFH